MKNHVRKGTIALGIAAATAIGLSLAGAKTPVVIRSTAFAAVLTALVSGTPLITGCTTQTSFGSGVDQSIETNLQDGEAKTQSGDDQGAIADFNKVLEINPQHAAAYYNRGNTKYKSGDLQGAVKDWKKAVELGDEDAVKLAKRIGEHLSK